MCFIDGTRVIGVLEGRTRQETREAVDVPVEFQRVRETRDRKALSVGVHLRRLGVGVLAEDALPVVGAVEVVVGEGDELQ